MPGTVRVLEIGPGSGRNTRALQTAGVEVDAMPADPGVLASLPDSRYDAVLSTHAMLHGTPPAIEALVRRASHVLKPGGRLYATFGSVRDARFGRGTKISAHAYAPDTGDESGVAHSYFNADEIRELTAAFRIVDLEEIGVDGIAGKWAHVTAPLEGAVHWFAVAEKKLR